MSLSLSPAIGPKVQRQTAEMLERADRAISEAKRLCNQSKTLTAVARSVLSEVRLKALREEIYEPEK